MVPHSGYVGFDQGGLLTNDVDKSGYFVILLGEIEKANPDMFNLLFQIMDHGKLTYSTAKVLNFAHTIIIMTTNCGVDQMSKSSIGFGKNGDDEFVVVRSVLEQIFNLEFRNKLDEMILINNVGSKEIAGIVEKHVDEPSCQLVKNNAVFVAEGSIKRYLVEKKR